MLRHNLQQKNAEIEMLRRQVESLSGQLAAALQAADQTQNSRRLQMISPHVTNVREVRLSNNKRGIAAQRERIGRTASISTQRVLDNLDDNEPDRTNPLIQRILDMFQKPSSHLDYLKSDLFAKDLLRLSAKVKTIFEREPRVVYLQSPCYVFGDIHGNLEDLHFFSDNIWRLGMSLTAGNFLFLGDYVDRGMNGPEVCAYLFAMKCLLPNKIFMLRGNHETRECSGWVEHYGDRSFMAQCTSRFGEDVGFRVWETINQVFDRLPLAGVIDQDIFCVHGGIPRPVSKSSRIQDILRVPVVAGINPPYEHEDEAYQQVASDCVWSDPATEEQELTVDPTSGFGESLRGGGAICFGNKAVTDFLQQHDLSYIMRAHEAHAEGVAISKEARVFTVFSTSKDHNQGNQALAGCILVDNDKLQVINRSPAYKNQYIHRRDSISVASLPEQEIQKRMKLGLISTSEDSVVEDNQMTEWQDFDSDDENDDDDGPGAFPFAKERKSSIDLDSMASNSHDEGDWEGDVPNPLIDIQANKRHCSKLPGFEPITEVDEDEDESEQEVDTVNGEDDIEIQDAN